MDQTEITVYSFFFQAEGGIRDLVRSRGLGDVYKSQVKRSKPLNEAAGAAATATFPQLPKSLAILATIATTQDGLDPAAVATDTLTRAAGPVSYTHLTLPTSALV